MRARADDGVRGSRASIRAPRAFIANDLRPAARPAVLPTGQPANLPTTLLALAFVLACTAAAPAVEFSARPPLITPATETAIEKGLAYLGRTQSRDGSWRTSGGWGNYPCAMTALSGLALLAAGNTPHEGPYATNVRRAVDYVLSCAGRTGLISRLEEEGQPMYGHGFSTLFLAEALGLENEPGRQAHIQQVLQRAVELTQRSQSAAGGWLYTPDANSDEGSVTITQIQGLRAARNAGVKVPKEVIDRACAYIEKCANKDGGISYSLQARGSSRPAITAAAVATLYNAGQYDNPVALRALEYCKQQLAAKDGGRSGWSGHKFYSMLYFAQAMYLSGDTNWNGFFPACRDELIKTQADSGSWAGEVGESYATAIALVVLQLPYRNLPILQR